MIRSWLALLTFTMAALAADDAPKPLSPAESLKRVTLPTGFRLELIAAEPLVREPSGMCWDEKGQLFVCELHGYNLEGQYDIEELNRAGVVDHVVRRIPANDKAIAAAKKEQTGTIRKLIDTDGDGIADKSIIFADNLPASYGIVPARGGLIVACAPDIIYLADRDGDGVAEIRETLFTGFGTHLMERRISNPQWTADNWITFGRGGGHCTITGPKLKGPVDIPNTDFRIKADGTAIEPVIGATNTIGFTSSDVGERYTISTNTPASYVPPLDWRYLARNPYSAASLPNVNLCTDQRCYPTSEAHPWRTQRAADPGFEKYYRERYGVTESKPNGYFTSLCSPLIYRDTALPGLHGQIIACEPAQNFLHRGVLGRRDGVPTWERPASEKTSEFLASSDVWFHPIALAHAPDGSIVLADFYREIIEDYSAIPRYLQQKYGLTNGKDHGRVWRITHRDQVKTPPADMSKLTTAQLAAETASPHCWRRETARRLLIERQDVSVVPVLAALSPSDPGIRLNVFSTLDGLGALTTAQIEPLLTAAHPGLRIQGLRYAERWFKDSAELRVKVLAMIDDADPGVVLQLALSLGECSDPRATEMLTRLARERGQQKWMTTAILSSIANRGGAMLADLLREPAKIGQAKPMIASLAAVVGARRDGGELSEAIVALGSVKDRTMLRTCLQALKQSVKSPESVSVSPAAKAALTGFAADSNSEIRTIGRFLLIAYRLQDVTEHKARLAAAATAIIDVNSPELARLAAVAELAFERDPESATILFNAVRSSTPKVRDAILAAVFAQRERHDAILAALENKLFPASVLSTLQRAALSESSDPAIRARAKKAFESLSTVNDETFRKYTAALTEKRDTARGETLFREKCAVCHQAHGQGAAVGPNLSAEFQRAEETIIRDILAPSDAISPGFTTYTIETTAGLALSGVLAGESASSVSMKTADGKEAVVLRKDIERLKAVTTSLMPDDLTKTMTPKDVADVIAWLRTPPTRVMLIDENPAIVEAFKQGDGVAKFITTDKHSGTMALEITPLQRARAKIPGWDYRIREHPAAGEYRYLRFAWKSVSGDGVLIELAADGKWPPAKAATRRYCSGKNTSGWGANRVADAVPREWTVVTVDLWKDFGDFKLTGIAPTALGGPALFDSIELLQTKP